MFKSIALGIGISLCVLGGEFLVVESVVLAKGSESSSQSTAQPTAFAPATGRREYTPPDWMPWSLLSAGAVTIIYSFTIPRRMAA